MVIKTNHSNLTEPQNLILNTLIIMQWLCVCNVECWGIAGLAIFWLAETHTHTRGMKRIKTKLALVIAWKNKLSPNKVKQSNKLDNKKILKPRKGNCGLSWFNLLQRYSWKYTRFQVNNRILSFFFKQKIQKNQQKWQFYPNGIYTKSSFLFGVFFQGAIFPEVHIPIPSTQHTMSHGDFPTPAY